MSRSKSGSWYIENKEHFEKLTKKSKCPSYVLVQRVDNRRFSYIPLFWMHQSASVQDNDQEKVWFCFYSNCIDDKHWLRNSQLTAVNVIQIYNGKILYWQLVKNSIYFFSVFI